MNANKLNQKSEYFQSGYYDGSTGYKATPTSNGRPLNEGSYAYSEYQNGFIVGSNDR